MPIIVLIQCDDSFIEELKIFFEDKYTVEIMKGEYKQIRSRMATLESSKLFLITNLNKPERYEVFCLARKNGEYFLTIVSKDTTECTKSDKNILVVEKCDCEEIYKNLLSSKITPTSANKRSKGVSLRSIGDLKQMIEKVNKDYSKVEGSDLILNECENKLIKMWNFNTQNSLEDAEICYKTMIEAEFKRRKI